MASDIAREQVAFGAALFRVCGSLTLPFARNDERKNPRTRHPNALQSQRFPGFATNKPPANPPWFPTGLSFPCPVAPGGAQGLASLRRRERRSGTSGLTMARQCDGQDSRRPRDRSRKDRPARGVASTGYRRTAAPTGRCVEPFVRSDDFVETVINFLLRAKTRRSASPPIPSKRRTAPTRVRRLEPR